MTYVDPLFSGKFLSGLEPIGPEHVVHKPSIHSGISPLVEGIIGGGFYALKCSEMVGSRPHRSLHWNGDGFLHICYLKR